MQHMLQIPHGRHLATDAECTALFIYFQQMLRQLFSHRAIYGPNAPSSNMHGVSIKDLMSPRLCLSDRIVRQRATMGRKTQIVQDNSEVCVSGSWFISGRSVLACVTRAAHQVLMELMLQTRSIMFWKLGVHWELNWTSLVMHWRIIFGGSAQSVRITWGD